MQLHYRLNMTILDTQSALTDRYQTTVPEPVRLALKLGKRDRIAYEVLESGKVLMSKVVVEPEDNLDPAVQAFLNFLQADLIANPQSLSPLTREYFEEIRQLTGGIDVDLDAPLDPADD